MNPEDTIVAVSTPAGASPRGIVRLSGPEALRIAEGICDIEAGESLSAIRANRCLSGRLRITGTNLPATLYVFRAPRSYTRQDVVELHILGAPVLLAMVVESCLAAGARRAEAGEFTARAFLAGAIDLTQVHAVAGVIAARCDTQLRAAQRLLHGDLSKTALKAREDLADLLSLVEGAMDFADEPIEFITPTALVERLRALHGALTATLDASLRGERWERLPRVVLVGRTNAGKSSLLNRLCGMDRAICAPLQATTRDPLAVPMTLPDGGECLLIDVAGLGEASDELDARAQAAARRCIRDADLLLHVFDATQPHTSDALPEASAAFLRVANKCDLLTPARRSALPADASIVSALTGDGCDALRDAMERVLRDRTVDVAYDAIALMAEHRDALNRAVEVVSRAMTLAESSKSSLRDADLVAAELHAAAAALGELVGREPTEEMLGRIFSRFCVGK